MFHQGFPEADETAVQPTAHRLPPPLTELQSFGLHQADKKFVLSPQQYATRQGRSDECWHAKRPVRLTGSKSCSATSILFAMMAAADNAETPLPVSEGMSGNARPIFDIIDKLREHGTSTSGTGRVRTSAAEVQVRQRPSYLAHNAWDVHMFTTRPRQRGHIRDRPRYCKATLTCSVRCMWKYCRVHRGVFRRTGNPPTILA